MTKFLIALALIWGTWLQAASYPMGLDISGSINLTGSNTYKESTPLYRVDSLNAYLVPLSYEKNAPTQPILLAAPYTIFNPTLYLVLDRSTTVASSPYLNSGFSNMCKFTPSSDSAIAQNAPNNFLANPGFVDSSRPGYMLLPSSLNQELYARGQIAEAEFNHSPFNPTNVNPAVLNQNISCAPGLATGNPLVYGTYEFPSPNFTMGASNGSFTSGSSTGNISLTDPPLPNPPPAPPIVPTPEPSTYFILASFILLCIYLRKKELNKLNNSLD